MNYFASARVRFAAGHSGPNPWCGEKPHGHSYLVVVDWSREGYALTDLDVWVRNRQTVLDLALELKNRDLGAMILPQHPNAFGVASFFMERLAIVIPVTRVEVREDDGPVAIIERDQ